MHKLMDLKIVEMHGIGPKLGQKLIKAGIHTLLELIEKGSDEEKRAEISAITGISEIKILKWKNMARLYCIEGINNENAELFEAAGIESLEDLQTKNPEMIYEKMRKINAAKRLVLSIPSLEDLQRMSESASQAENCLEA
jgi:predicted RecB family nuclease